MKSDTIRLKWIASHLTGFTFGLYNIDITWIDDEGVKKTDVVPIPVELQSNMSPSVDVKLLRVAVDTILKRNKEDAKKA